MRRKCIKEGIIEKVLEVLPNLKPKEFDYRGLSRYVGCSEGTLWNYFADRRMELHPCFKGVCPQDRWALYHREELLNMAGSVKSGKEFEDLVKQKYRILVNTDRIDFLLEDTNWIKAWIKEFYLVEDNWKFENSVEATSYMVGYFLGDGSYKVDGEKRITGFSLYTTKEKYLKKLMDDLPYFVRREYTKGRENSIFEFRCFSKKLKGFLIDLGIPNRKTYVDYSLVGWEKLNLIEMIAGFIDSDGWLHRTGSGYYMLETSSYSFNNQLLGSILKGFSRSNKPKDGKNIPVYMIALDTEFSKKINKESIYLNKRKVFVGT